MNCTFQSPIPVKMSWDLSVSTAMVEQTIQRYLDLQRQFKQLYQPSSMVKPAEVNQMTVPTLPPYTLSCRPEISMFFNSILEITEIESEEEEAGSGEDYWETWKNYTESGSDSDEENLEEENELVLSDFGHIKKRECYELSKGEKLYRAKLSFIQSEAEKQMGGKKMDPLEFSDYVRTKQFKKLPGYQGGHKDRDK